jgi:hypothetical protein
MLGPLKRANLNHWTKVNSKYGASRIVITPLGWLYNFLVIVIISSVITVSYLMTYFLFMFTWLSIIIIPGVIIMIVAIIFVDSENISFDARLVT